MQCEYKIFAELFGLAVFDFKDLLSFKLMQQLDDDLLHYFTTSTIGDKVTKNGIVIPIIGIEGDYYCLNVQINNSRQLPLTPEQISVHSTGWILYSSTGEITICGIGYLKQFDKEFKRKVKYIEFNIPPGWYEVSILGGIDSNQ